MLGGIEILKLTNLSRQSRNTKQYMIFASLSATILHSTKYHLFKKSSDEQILHFKTSTTCIIFVFFRQPRRAVKGPKI